MTNATTGVSMIMRTLSSDRYFPVCLSVCVVMCEYIDAIMPIISNTA